MTLRFNSFHFLLWPSPAVFHFALCPSLFPISPFTCWLIFVLAELTLSRLLASFVTSTFNENLSLSLSLSSSLPLSLPLKVIAVLLKIPLLSFQVGTSDTCNVNLMESDKSKENLLSETIYKCNITPNAFEKRFERLFESISHINNFNWSLNYFHPFVDQLNQLGSKNICQGRYSSLTILHLVSALGFIDLLKLLLNYTKCHRESLLVKGQLNTRSVDGQNCIPLMWSCARGHVDCSLVLAHLDPETVNLCNKEHLTPLELAIGNGHEQLARELFKLKVTQVAVRISLGEKCKETLQLPLVDGRRRRKNASLRGNSMDGKVYCTCSCFCRNNNNSSSNNKSVDDINCSSGKSGANNITSDAHGCTCDCCCISTCPPPCTLTGDGRRSTRRRRTRSNRTSSTSDATGDADATLTGTCTASATTAGKEVQVNANKCTNHTASEAIVFHATQHQQSNCNGLHTGYCQVAADSVTDSVSEDSSLSLSRSLSNILLFFSFHSFRLLQRLPLVSGKK